MEKIPLCKLPIHDLSGGNHNSEYYFHSSAFKGLAFLWGRWRGLVVVFVLSGPQMALLTDNVLGCDIYVLFLSYWFFKSRNFTNQALYHDKILLPPYCIKWTIFTSHILYKILLYLRFSLFLVLLQGNSNWFLECLKWPMSDSLLGNHFITKQSNCIATVVNDRNTVSGNMYWYYRHNI